ncbi:hypothetical protein PMCNE_04470 [Pasteurella multocida]|uniref:DUF4411 family protein n=1 Tax=Pasteurella multocida TaxID=747 RepID=UPI0007439C85|nr:DUF4411 family protein [Pasteurella multocida]KUM15494.1 hypothetical protein ASV60_00125 [Pasteurella multocida]MCL7757706.1 DUF4411 family protein [Pasteurella multocida]MCL7820219.1 DUF4411 family protein [Pasteurella multocida]MCL7822464.1 DUF4411 family protein [Pasteurella multocida]OBP35448.1 hypothetical protein A0R74_00125 [Pasteurella multocida subsp. multocida]
MERFLIDANIFISAKNLYYQFGFCQAFWDFLATMHQKGIVFSIQAVKQEMLRQNDPLKDWVNTLPDTFFEDQYSSEASYATLMNYAQGLDVKQIAKDEFAKQENADAWLLAHAMEQGFTIITHEKFNPAAKKRIMIPNVAQDHNIKVVTLFEFLERFVDQGFIPKP